MKFDVRFVPSAEDDLDFYETREQRIIIDAIGEFLEADADVEGKRGENSSGQTPSRPGNSRLGTTVSSTRSGKKAW
jgi:hypothetical protein